MLPLMATFALVSFVAGPALRPRRREADGSLGAACITSRPFLFSLVDETRATAR